MYTKFVSVNPRYQSCLAAASERHGVGMPRRQAFTLIELLMVVAVIVLMTTLAIPAFNAIRGGTDFTSEVYEIAGLFDQARAYATANNTYVLAGIEEVSGAQDTTANPQASGTGRVAVALIASKSGMRPYQTLLLSQSTFQNSFQTWRSSMYLNGSAFVAVTNLMPFQNIHLVDLQYNGGTALTVPASGNMARPVLSSFYYDLSNANGAGTFWFAWPLGTYIKPGATPSYQYEFQKMVEFDPEGSARLLYSSNPLSYPDAVPQYLEIGLQPSHGGVAAAVSQAGNVGQIAAIQINGITGAVRIYKP